MYKRMLATIVLLLATTAPASAEWNRSIEAEWFPYTTPTDVTLTGFRLYQEAIPVCNFPADSNKGTCIAALEKQTTSFTLTAVFGDTESPHSEPYQFVYEEWKTGPMIIKIIININGRNVTTESIIE